MLRDGQLMLLSLNFSLVIWLVAAKEVLPYLLEYD